MSSEDNKKKNNREEENLNLMEFLEILRAFLRPGVEKVLAFLKKIGSFLAGQAVSVRDRILQGKSGAQNVSGPEAAFSELADGPEGASAAIPPRRPVKKRRKKRFRINYKRFLLFILVVVLVLFIIVKSISGYVEKSRKEAELRQQIMSQAAEMAQIYNYDGAIEKLRTIRNYEDDKEVTEQLIGYKQEKKNMVPFSASQVIHIFYHSLVVDPERAFTGEGSAGFKQWMTTVSEFNKITEMMYEDGYVLVDVKDFVQEVKDDDGNVHFTEKSVYLPKGKKPFVLSLDDLSYYHSYDGKGTATKLVLDEDGKITCEYIKKTGKTVTGAYDCVPLLNQFLEKHPDGCLNGARGIIALTGYNGIFGYRTDISYKTQTDIDQDKRDWLRDNPDFDYDKECKKAKKIADELKNEGWTFASHTWGHQKVGLISLEALKKDTERWLDNVAPLIGGSDVIIFAHGSDLATSVSKYDESDKYQYLKKKGFSYFMNVYSGKQCTLEVKRYFVHQGRMNLDGYRLWNEAKGKTHYLDNLVDAKKVLDPVRTDMPEL